jgi:hypothetical protein
MKLASFLFCGLICAGSAFAGDQKQLPNQAGNENLDLAGTVLLTPSEIRDALGGNDLAGANVDPSVIVVRLKVTPKAAQPPRVGPDDFTLISRKNGERCPALAPNQVAGGGNVLVLKPAAQQPGGDGTAAGGIVWGGVTKKKASSSGGDSAPVVKRGDSSDAPILPVLARYLLPDKEVKTPEEGLLYFSISGKLKPKDLSLIYDGEAGKLVIDFK